MEAPRIDTNRGSRQSPPPSPQPEPPRIRRAVQSADNIIARHDTDESFGKGLAFASFACGLLALPMFFAAIVCLPLSLIGLSSGIIGLRSLVRRRSGWKGLATVAIILNALAMLAMIYVLLIFRLAML